MAKTYECECGCGQEAYFNQLVEVRTERAIDQTLTKRETEKTFLVLNRCRDAFIEELQMMQLLQQLVVQLAPTHRRWGLVRFWLHPFGWIFDVREWYLRMKRVVQVMRLQHAIYERTKGYDYARRRATRSGILFAAPRIFQRVIARWFLAQMKAEEEAKKPKLEVVK